MLFSALVVVLLFQCSFSLIVFNTKAFVDGESLPVTVFAQQRPEVILYYLVFVIHVRYCVADMWMIFVKLCFDLGCCSRFYKRALAESKW